MQDGKEFALLNEFDKKENFYTKVAVEKKLRSWALIFPHAYLVCIFACCRQIYDKERMSGFPRDLVL